MARRREQLQGSAAGVALVALLAGAFVLRRSLGLDWSVESVRAFVGSYGLWAPALFVALVGLRPFLLIPSQILLLAGGVCFGSAAGTTYGALGMAVSGIAAFALARRLGREAVQARFPAQLGPVMEAVGGRWGAVLLAFGTAYPVGPVTAYHAGAGLTDMPSRRFLLALAPGALGRAALFTLFGATLAAGNLQHILLAGAALLGLLLVPLAHGGVRRRLRRVMAVPSGE